MENNNDFSYLLPPVIEEQKRQVDTIAKDIKYKSTPLAQQQTDSLYSVASLNNMNVDKRMEAVDYSTKFSDVYETLSDGTPVAKYETYLPGTNNEERLAQQQSTTEKWGNGLAKLALKTGTAVVGGTVGIVDSLIAGISKGSLNEAYNSGVNVWLDDLNTQLDYKLPNHYTEQEKNASFLGQMGQANFYADKLFGGLSFMTGIIISEAIWTAATAATFGAAEVGLATNTARIARGLEKWSLKGVGETGIKKILNAAKATAKTPTSATLEATTLEMRAISSFEKAGSRLGYSVGKGLDIIVPIARSAGYESGMEARLYEKQTEARWLEKYEDENGRAPSSEEYADFKSKLANSADGVFIANMAILSISNYAQFGNAILGRTTARTIENNIFRRMAFGQGFDRVIDAEGKSVLRAIEATKGQKIFGKVYGLGKNFVTESQEEMGQSVVTGTAENYIMAGYDKDKIKTSYGLMDAFHEGLERTYGSKEGWTEGLVGGLIGILGGVGGGIMNVRRGKAFHEITNERGTLQNAIDYSNGITADMHLSNVIANNRMQYAQELKEQAKIKNDITGEVLANTTSGVARIERDIAIGGLEEGIKDYNRQVNALSPEYLMEELGFETKESAEEYKEHLIAEHKTLADSYSENLAYAESLVGNKDFAGSKDLGANILEIQRGIAMNLTMGEKSRKIHSDITGVLNDEIVSLSNVEGVTDGLNVQQILDLAPKEKVQNLQRLGREKRNLENRRKTQQDSITKAGKVVEGEEASTRTNRLLELTNEIAETEQAIATNEEQRQIALNGIGIEQYTEGTITADMIDAQGTNVEKFMSFMKDLAQKNPQKYNKIVRLLEQQSKSIQHIKNYEKSVQAVTNKTTRLKTINGWLSSLLSRNKKLKDGQKAYFLDLLESYNEQTIVVKQESEELKNRRLFEEGKEVDPAYIKALEKDSKKLHPIDQQILDQSRGEGVATIKDGTPSINDRIQELEKERDDKIANLQEESIAVNNLQDIDKLTEEQKQELKDNVKAQIDKLSEDIFFLTHLTQTTQNLDSILRTGLNTGAAIEGTTNTSVDKESLFNSISALIDGKVRHAGASNLVIMAFPKSIVPEGASKNSYITFVEDYIAENNPSDFGQRIPVSANVATFSNGELSILGETSSKKTEVSKKQIEKIKSEYAKKIKELQPVSETISPIDALKERVQQITSHPYYSQYFGESFNEKNRNKPKESDTKEYEELLSKINRKVESKLSRILDRPSNYKYKGDLGLTVEEIDRLKELNQILGDWQTFQGTSAGNNESVADLLERINALEVKISAEEAVTELNEESYKVVVSESEEESTKKSSDNRGLSTPVQALRTRMANNTYRWSHITKEKFATFFNDAEGILQDDKKKGFAVVLQNGKTINATYNNRGGFDMPIQEWENAQVDSNILVKNFGNNSTAINQSIGLDSQGNEQFEIVYGDAGYLQTNGDNLEINEAEVNKVKNNDVLDLFVSSTDAFNAETKTLSKEQQKDRERHYHIYVYKNGNLIASLPAGYENEGIEGVGLPLKDLRQNAKNFAEKQIKEGKTGLIKLPYKVEANIIFVGQPNLTLQKDENGVVSTKQNSFTLDNIKLVRGQGYIQDGVVTSSTKVDVKQFITKLSKSKESAGKKIPFVIFEYNGKNVAFPVNLIQMSNPQDVDLRALFADGTVDNNTKIKRLIETLNDNGINPNQFGIDYSDSENFTTQTEAIEKALTALENVTEVVDIERFAKNDYKAESLIKDATIAIDIERTPFLSSKIMMKMSNKIDSDVLGYREFSEQLENERIAVTSQLSDIYIELNSDYRNNSSTKYLNKDGSIIENAFTDAIGNESGNEVNYSNPTSDTQRRSNITLLRKAFEKVPKNVKGIIGVKKVEEIKNLLERFKSLQKKEKDIKQQIKDSEYYQDIDTTFATVDNEGNLENPYINETEAIQEIGGIKTEEEFNEALESSDLEYLKTSKAPLFQDMSQFNNIPVKEIINGELVDKLNTEVKDTLEATLREPENNALAVSLSNLEGYSESVWNSSPEAVKTLLKDIEKQALTINVDLRGLADTYDTKLQVEILAVTESLNEMIKNPTEATLENFINVYQDFTNVVQEIERAVVKVDEKYRELPLIKLETTASEYKTFKEQGLLKVQESVYIKTDSNEKSIAEVENLSATNTKNFPAGTIQGDVKNTELVKEDLNTFVETQMADVLTNDAEYDVDAVKKLIYYKTYFGTQGIKTAEKSFEQQLSQIAISDIKNRDYLVSDFIADVRNKQLKGENPVLYNLVFSEKGIQLRYTDLISVEAMNEYLKEDEDLRNYFLLSKNTNFEVTGVAQDEIVNERDLMVNGATKENFKDAYRTINSETLQLKSSEDFITVDGVNYERAESDFYVKLPSNTTGFLEINVEKPTLNIDTSSYSSVQSEAEVSVNNKYSAEESKKIDDSLACE